MSNNGLLLFLAHSVLDLFWFVSVLTEILVSATTPTGATSTTG